MCATVAQQIAIELLQLRVEPAAGNAELGARFEDAQAGRADIVVLALRFGHQRIQHRVVEIAPPLIRNRLCRGVEDFASVREGLDQPSSQGTSGGTKSGPTAVQALSSTESRCQQQSPRHTP